MRKKLNAIRKETIETIKTTVKAAGGEINFAEVNESYTPLVCPDPEDEDNYTLDRITYDKKEDELCFFVSNSLIITYLQKDNVCADALVDICEWLEENKEEIQEWLKEQKENN